MKKHENGLAYCKYCKKVVRFKDGICTNCGNF